ncbi:MAG TPA: GNAT family N-acetyltransferase [Cyclobacteriaceae bacterium]
MNYIFRSDKKISPSQFIDILKRSTLDERRPVNSLERIEKMLVHGNVLITAWDNEKLIGISRALTDFSFCCYLSDLAVDKDYQKIGIGKKLIEETHKVAGVLTSLILLAAPTAAAYYPKIGMENFKDCFIIRRK